MKLLKFFDRGKKRLKQEVILRKALSERKIPLKNLKIEIDHLNGTNSINGVLTGIIYPDSFFRKAEKLIPRDKTLNFYFNGNMSGAGERKHMMAPFVELDKSIIINSDVGRINFLKDKFNKSYYKGLAMAKFGLCPHQKDWPGDRDNMWTYRFIECCMVKTIPVAFEEAPLGKNFTKDFKFYHTKDVLSGKISYSHEEASYNLDQARKRFSLTDDQVQAILKTI